MNLNQHRRSYYKGKYGYKNFKISFNFPLKKIQDFGKLFFKMLAGLIIILLSFLLIFYIFRQELTRIIIKQSNIYNDKRILYLINRETTDLRAKIELIKNKTDELESHSYIIYYKLPKKRVYRTIDGRKVIR